VARILAIDYGAVRTGFAWTDPLQMIATALPPCETTQIWEKLSDWLNAEPIDLILIGMPLRMNNEPTHATPLVESFALELQKRFPNVKYKFWDERFTSKMAQDTMIQAGSKKKQRQNKMTINSVSATILLQNYLASLT
jgi:putative Holliday junction resolvase